MRSVMVILLILASLAPALAMNWEGHDDWMESMEPAIIYEQSTPHAAPEPRSACPPPAAAVADNPYEQIPLARPDCPAMPEMPKHPR